MRSCVWRVYAHSGFVRGLTVAPDGRSFFSCGDKTVKQWELCVAGDTSEVRHSRFLPLSSFETHSSSSPNRVVQSSSSFLGGLS